MTNNIWNITPSFSYLKRLQAINILFVTITKLSSNETRETFSEGLKSMCKLFEIDLQRDF